MCISTSSAPRSAQSGPISGAARRAVMSLRTPIRRGIRAPATKFSRTFRFEHPFRYLGLKRVAGTDDTELSDVAFPETALPDARRPLPGGRPQPCAQDGLRVLADGRPAHL